MVLTEEQSKKIKEHLLRQLGNFPEEKREIVKEQVESMTKEQVENFVEENELEHLEGECLFCGIADGKNPSFKIAETADDIAVLEINPISKGNTLIIPKKHRTKIMQHSSDFAKIVSTRINERLNPKEIKMREFEAMGHQILEIIPIYGDEKDRKKATPEELKQIQDEITSEKKVEEKKVEIKEGIVEQKQVEEIVKLKPRIP